MSWYNDMKNWWYGEETTTPTTTPDTQEPSWWDWLWGNETETEGGGTAPSDVQGIPSVEYLEYNPNASAEYLNDIANRPPPKPKAKPILKAAVVGVAILMLVSFAAYFIRSRYNIKIKR